MKRPLTMFCVGLIAICLLYHYLCHIQSPAPELPAEAVILQGRVTALENRYENNILYLSDICFYGNSADEITTNHSIGIRCFVTNTEGIKLGQTVAVQGFLTLEETALNDGGFDAAAYYESKGYAYVLYEAEILENGKTYDWLLQGLYIIKSYAIEQLYTYLEPEDAGVLSAMLTGDKSKMDAETKELYKTVGIYHILAISGLHISMIGGVFYKLLKRLCRKRYLAAGISLLLLILYGIMIGMPPSAFRAIVMFAFGLAAPIMCRSHDKITSLAVAGACLILWEPLLFFDGGVQLSFLAVLGIVCLYPTFLGLHRHRMSWGDGFFVSFAILYMTLPIVMHTYYEIPIYSFLANALVLPFIAVLIAAGFVIVLCGTVLGSISRMAAVLVHCILFFYEKVLTFFAKLPGCSYVTGAPETYRIILFYAVLFLLIWSIYRIKRRLLIKSLRSENAYAEGRQAEYEKQQTAILKAMSRVRLIQGMVMILMIWFLLVPERFDCRITFLNVGQGDGVCIEAEGNVFLIDCGSTTENMIGTYSLIPFLKHHGISQVDGWFLTHPDVDHTSAFVEICSEEDMGGIYIKTLYIPQVLKDEFTDILMLAGERKISVVMLEANDRICAGKAEWTVLSPSGQSFYGDENAASLVLYLQYEQFEGLFMGDAGMVAERDIAELGIGEVTLLKVAHHGSAIDTNSEWFLSEMCPQIAVISCGKHNFYGHPHEEVLERLYHCESYICRTDINGQITITIRRNKLTVSAL